MVFTQVVQVEHVGGGEPRERLAPVVRLEQALVVKAGV
jgi:hypothetical protein